MEKMMMSDANEKMMMADDGARFHGGVARQRRQPFSDSVLSGSTRIRCSPVGFGSCSPAPTSDSVVLVQVRFNSALIRGSVQFGFTSVPF
ncbi:hypothetical protein Hanom_Chr03g00209021 [Helianthus anomalus]